MGPNPALREELDGLDGEALALRCRRNGLSRAGDREGGSARGCTSAAESALSIANTMASQILALSMVRARSRSSNLQVIISSNGIANHVPN